MKKLVVITGASGAGKTTMAKKLEADKNPDLIFCYFDSIGVPSKETMIKEFGSEENWQRAKTEEWIELIKNKYPGSEVIVLDGQTRPSFVAESCKKQNIENYELVLIDCSDEVRSKRLVERGHPDLVNDEMMSWARVLRDESQSKGYKVIDTTNLNLDQSKAALALLLK